MRTKLKQYISKIWLWAGEWNEIFMLPIMFGLLLISTPFFRWFSPTAGTYDIGILQTTIVAGFCFAFGSVMSWLTYKLSWPKLAEWLDDTMEKRLSHKSQDTEYDLFHFRKAVLGLAVYFIYFGFYCWILTSILS